MRRGNIQEYNFIRAHSVIFFRHIATDGTLQGPNFDHLSVLQNAVSMDITASGGIRDKSHIDRLKKMGLFRRFYRIASVDEINKINAFYHTTVTGILPEKWNKSVCVI